MQQFDFALRNYDNLTLTRVQGSVLMGPTPHNIENVHITIQGYESYHSGPIVTMEIWEGRLRLLVWKDINSQDPEIIDLEGARLTERKEQIQP